MADRFRIEFERSGGFPGVPLRASIDSSELPSHDAHELEELLDRIDFRTLAEQPPTRETDRFQYDITLERAGQRQRITLGERAVPPELRPLFERLLDKAKKRA